MPVVLSCGPTTEDVERTWLMARALQGQGHDSRPVESRDVLTGTGWRDTVDPEPVELVRRARARSSGSPATRCT